MTMAIRRGSTRTWTGDSPRVEMASISSVTFMAPSWAVKAAPERPAMRMAVSMGESSRATARAMPSTTKMLAPNFCTWMPSRKANTTPTRKVIRAMMGSAPRPTA